MLALIEKPRTVVLFGPSLVRADKQSLALKEFQGADIEVKARKDLYMTAEQAHDFCAHLDAAEREKHVTSLTSGLSEVMVLEHLNGKVVADTCRIVEALSAKELKDEVQDSPGALYCSLSPWEAQRDLELFFPHLDTLGVERTLVIAKSHALMIGQRDGMTIVDCIEAEAGAQGLFVVGRRELCLKDDQGTLLCKELEGAPSDHANAKRELMSDAGVVALCLEGRGAIGKFQLLAGPSSSATAQQRAPSSLRARWGTDSNSNAVHASLNLAASEAELASLFPEGSLKMQRTLCIVKPDGMANLLPIQTFLIDAGFTILCEQQMTLTEDRAKEFYRAFKNEPSYQAMVRHACSGPCCVLVLYRLEAVSILRQLMGPVKVKDAKALTPWSLRAQFGRDTQRNAIHGSESITNAAWEVRFFFPEMGADPIPDDNEVRDFLFRKAAGASMDLRTMSETNPASFEADPTLQHLLSKGLMELCRVQPKGLAAVKWLSRWLAENNPNTKKDDQSFNPPARTNKYIEHGINEDGMVFTVEPPKNAEIQKQVIDVDVSEEVEEHVIPDLATPPFVVCVVGGPGSGKSSQCEKLRESLNFVVLNSGDLMKEEVRARTYIGTEIYKCMQNGEQVPDRVILQLIKKAMLKNQDVNRFLLDGFPRSVEHAVKFEQEIAEIAFVLHLDMSADAMKQRLQKRLQEDPGRVDDQDSTVAKRIESFQQQVAAVIGFYSPIGKIRKINAEPSVDEVFESSKGFLRVGLLYLVGPPGSPLNVVAQRLEQRYGYSMIDVMALLQEYAKSSEVDAGKVMQALEGGKCVDASIVCPLVLSEIYRDMALGVQNFVLCGFPQSLKQASFLEHRVPSTSRTLLLDFTQPDAEELLTFLPSGNFLQAQTQVDVLYGQETQEMLKTLQNVIKVPCSLSRADSVVGGAPAIQERLAEQVWSDVCKAIKPGVTIVLGPPCCGAEILAEILSAPDSVVAVDCDQLLDKELERRTEVGVSMHNMLARGQVVPLSTTLELLKNTASTTCSDSLVLQNCPLYVDQVEYISEQFRIERVYHIAGGDAAIQAWRAAYGDRCKIADPPRDVSLFDSRMESMVPIVKHFSQIGLLERLDFETVTPESELRGMFLNMLEQTSKPSYAVIMGLDEEATKRVSGGFAIARGLPSPTTREALGLTWNPKDLKSHGESANIPGRLLQMAKDSKSSFLVLDGYPANADEAAALKDILGPPKVVINLTNVQPESTEEASWSAAYKEKNEGEEVDDEQLVKYFKSCKDSNTEAMKIFEECCPANVFQVDVASETPDARTQEVVSILNKKLRPTVFVIVAPEGQQNLSASVAEAICLQQRPGGQTVKYNVIDAASLFKVGGHGSFLDDQMHKASFTAASCDAVSPALFTALLQESLQNSADPEGCFLIINYPTRCSMSSSPTIRDQFHLLQSICTFMGVLTVQVPDDAFLEWCSQDAEEMVSYQLMEGAAYPCARFQFNEDTQVERCEVSLSDGFSGAVDKVLGKFYELEEKSQQGAAELSKEMLQAERMKVQVFAPKEA